MLFKGLVFYFKLVVELSVLFIKWGFRIMIGYMNKRVIKFFFILWKVIFFSCRLYLG